MKQIMLIIALTLTAWQATGQDNRQYIVKVGDPAPDIELISLDGTRQRLGDLRGRVVMLQFTASWCGVCRQEMPYIERDIWLKHKSNPAFRLYGIDLKESKEVTEKFASDMHITYPLLLDPEGKAFYSVAEQGAGVTRNVIIDQQGNIAFLTRLYDKQEFSQMIAVIEKLLLSK